MNRGNLKELIRLANHLDKIGERKIANELDSVIKKASLSLNKVAEGPKAFTLYVMNPDTREEIYCCDIDTAKEVRKALRDFKFDKYDFDDPDSPAMRLEQVHHDAGEGFDYIVIRDNKNDHRTELSVEGLKSTFIGKDTSTESAKRTLGERDRLDEIALREERKRMERPDESALMPENKGDGEFSGELFFSDASKVEKRISKFASLLSGEFGGLDKKIRR